MQIGREITKFKLNNDLKAIVEMARTNIDLEPCANS